MTRERAVKIFNCNYKKLQYITDTLTKTTVSYNQNSSCKRASVERRTRIRIKKQQRNTPEVDKF